jgi:deoxyadenosine/deoxycytidine kinase
MDESPRASERGPRSAPPRVIAVAGTMGAGKSSIVTWLRDQFGMVPFFEPNEENPYLADFYGDMRRWALHSQLFFLVRRFEIHKDIDARAKLEGRPIVQDRTIYEDAEIFAAHLHRAGHIDDRDWAMYQDLYATLRREIRPPDLLVYLRCPMRTLKKRIARRGRAFEQAIPTAYLASLEVLYEEWLARYDLSPTIVVETDKLDYVEDLFDRQELLERIRSAL